jgi:hypothetical protein
MCKSRIIPVFVLAAVVFFACADGFEDYSNNPRDLLRFSTDTVAFDTIISSVRTPYRLFKVYNPHEKALRIASVALENDQSPFRINVDGQAGNAFSNIEIRGGDSIYVLVDAKPAESNADTPTRILDRVVFTTHGIHQTVVIEASAQDATLWQGKTIRADTTLAGAKPFVIYDSLCVEAGACLEIHEGVRLFMHGNASIVVKGTLKIKGSQEKPVEIRGDRFDYFVNIPYDRVPGQWGGIRFEPESYNNEIEYASIRNGKYGLDFPLADHSQLKLKLKNTVMRNFKGTLINAENCRIEAENCEFTNAKNGILRLAGGVYRFTHCTIANYYISSVELGWGNSNRETVCLLGSRWNEETADTEYYPLLQADFYNSIIWGTGQNSDVAFDADSQAEVRFLFQNCLIPNSKATNDDPNDPEAQTLDCLMNQDPKFRLTNSPDFMYDFRLDSLSPARNRADIQIARQIPLDLDGVDRLLDEGPDLGAYEFQPRLP